MPNESPVTAAIEAASAEIVAPSADYATPAGREDHFQASLEAAMKETPPDAPVPTDGKAAIAIAEARANEAAKAKTVDEAEEAEAAETAAEIEAVDEDEHEETVVEDKGALAKARRLFREGSINEAMELAGFDIDKVNPTTKQWKAVKRYVSEAKEESATVKAEAEAQIAKVREIAANLVPLARGAEAYVKGDIAGFIRLTTGDTPEEFQRKLIASFHDAPATDPRIMAKLNQIENDRAAERAEAQRLKEQNDALIAEQAETRWLGEMASELKTDNRFAKVATKEKFLKQVLEVQRANVNPKTKMTLTHTEAAELVWDEIYGGVVDDPQPAGGKAGSTRSDRANSDKTGRGGSNGASKKTNLRHDRSTEAAPDEFDGEWSPQNQEKMLESYIRKAKSVASA